jgi:hypothetical protein
MKHSSWVMSFVMALTMPTVMLPQLSTPTQPTKPPATQTTARPRKTSNRRTLTAGPRVRQPAPQSEPFRGTLARARPSEP